MFGSLNNCYIFASLNQLNLFTMSNQTKLVLSLLAIVIGFVVIIQLLEYFLGAHVVFFGALCLIPFAFAWCKYDDYKYKKKIERYHNQFKH